MRCRGVSFVSRYAYTFLLWHDSWNGNMCFDQQETLALFCSPTLKVVVRSHALCVRSSLCIIKFQFFDGLVHILSGYKGLSIFKFRWLDDATGLDWTVSFLDRTKKGKILKHFGSYILKYYKKSETVEFFGFQRNGKRSLDNLSKESKYQFWEFRHVPPLQQCRVCVPSIHQQAAPPCQCLQVFGRLWTRLWWLQWKSNRSSSQLLSRTLRISFLHTTSSPIATVEEKKCHILWFLLGFHVFQKFEETYSLLCCFSVVRYCRPLEYVITLPIIWAYVYLYV